LTIVDGIQIIYLGVDATESESKAQLVAFLLAKQHGILLMTQKLDASGITNEEILMQEFALSG